MTFERLQSLRALALVALAATASLPAAAAPAAAASPPVTNESRDSKSFAIVRTGGTCPKTVTLATHAKGYEGGAEIEFTARTGSFAVAPRAVVKRAGRIEFAAMKLKPSYANCEATARFSDAGNSYQLALHAGAMRFIMLPSAELTLMGTSVASGNVTVKMAVAD